MHFEMYAAKNVSKNRIGIFQDYIRAETLLGMRKSLVVMKNKGSICLRSNKCHKLELNRMIMK